MDPLILASASPQRTQLLTGIGLPHVVIPSRVNEEACTERDPVKRARLLAREKAQEVAERHRGRWVIGCDTLVVAPDGTLLEKPVDEADARRMLQLQSGGVSTVHSALCVISDAGVLSEGLCSSCVHFKQLSDTELDWWMRSKQWENRSGAFQIDGLGQLMIAYIQGDWTGIVGMPVFLLGSLLREAAHPFMR